MGGLRARGAIAAVVVFGAIVTSVPGRAASQVAEEDAAPRGGAVEIDLRGNRFHPDFEIVTTGTTVIWVNHDRGADATHDVYAEDGFFSSPAIAAGERWSFTFDVEGFWTYSCSYHEGMSGMIMVVPADEPLLPE